MIEISLPVLIFQFFQFYLFKGKETRRQIYPKAASLIHIYDHIYIYIHIHIYICREMYIYFYRCFYK